MTLCRSLLVGAVALVLANAAAANEAVPPELRKPAAPAPALKLGLREVPFQVLAAPRDGAITLVVPANLLQEAAGKQGADAGFLHPLVVSGIALSLAFVTGGFFLLRGGRHGKTLAGAAVLVAALVVGYAAQANIAPVGLPYPVKFPTDVRFDGKLYLEVVPEGTGVKLLVPPSQVIAPEKAAETGKEGAKP